MAAPMRSASGRVTASLGPGAITTVMCQVVSATKVGVEVLVESGAGDAA